jgi:hypothetical protein
MKRVEILLIALFLFMAIDQSQGQIAKNELKKEKKVERKALRKLKGAYVNGASKGNFIKSFGKQSGVIWKRGDFFDVATFKEGGHVLSAYFDELGKLVGTTSVVAFEDIPVNAQKKITKTYKNAKISKVIFFDDNELNDTDMILYGIQFDDADNYFVEMTQGTKKFVLDCNKKGNVTFFKQL